MPEPDPLESRELVEGARFAAPANVCCVALTIVEPTLQKPRGYRCRNSLPDNGCAIYESRPPTCQKFFCGWRRLKWVRETLRPDSSGVLTRLHYEAPNPDGPRNLGVVFTLLNNMALKAEGLAETIAAAVAADIPVYLEIPGPPGHTSGVARVNDALSDAVFRKDKPAILQILRQGRAQARAGSHQPIAFTTEDPADFGDNVRRDTM